MPPTSPYCATTHVYVLRIYQQDMGEEDFQDNGDPPRSAVEQWIRQIAARMDQAFASAGYILPFEAISGETWPEYQTFFLQFMNAAGVASMLGKDAAQTQIYNLAAGERASRSRHQIEWESMINGVEQKIAEKRLRSVSLIRAATRSGSNAEWLLSAPAPPLLPSVQGYRDPAMTDDLREFTLRKIYYIEEITSGNPPDPSNPYSPDYMSGLKAELGL